MANSSTGNQTIDKSLKKNKTQQSLTPVLPDHLIMEQILPKLPVKSLLSCKSVCKYWLSTILSSEFVKSHVKYSSLCPQFIILSEDHTEEEHYHLYLVPYDEYNNVMDLVRLDFDEMLVFTNLDVVGSCNGLLCLYVEEERKYGRFYLWNPATRQCREVLNPEGEAFALDYGFGYAAGIDDYKIVALFSPKKFKFGSVYVFSMRSGEWKRIDGLDRFYAALSLEDHTVVINGIWYWPRKKLKDWQEAEYVFAFDLGSEELKQISWMKWLGKYNRVDFVGMRGCLALHCCGEQGSDVWILKQYGDWNSWEKLFAVNFGGLYFLNFAETGKCLVRDFAQLKVVDTSQDAPEQSQAGTYFYGCVTTSGSYIESLISPFGTT